MTHETTVRGARISQDQDGYLSLTDLWRIAGKDDGKRPARWRELPTTKELVAALTQNIGFSDVIANSQTKSAIYAKQGKGGSTYAHHILALAYVEYLNPEIGLEIREIALRCWAGDRTLSEETRWHNQVLAIHAREFGARSPNDFAEFHNSGYRGLYNGEDENDIHRRKQLSKDQAILDHMTSPEAAANWFRITQAEQRLKCNPVDAFEDACLVHHDTGERIRQAMKDMGNPMPEDMPVADNIGDAKRRLTAHKREQKKLT